MGYQWDADLVDMLSFSTVNEVYEFILVATDILSRFLGTKSLKSMQGIEVS